MQGGERAARRRNAWVATKKRKRRPAHDRRSFRPPLLVTRHAYHTHAPYAACSCLRNRDGGRKRDRRLQPSAYAFCLSSSDGTKAGVLPTKNSARSGEGEKHLCAWLTQHAGISRNSPGSGVDAGAPGFSLHCGHTVEPGEAYLDGGGNSDLDREPLWPALDVWKMPTRLVRSKAPSPLVALPAQSKNTKARSMASGGVENR